MNDTCTDEYAPQTTATVEVIRLTPLHHGIPQHTDASTWNFHDQVTLVMLRRLSTAEDDEIAPGIWQSHCPVVTDLTAGLITDRHFLCHQAATYIDHLLDRHRDTGMAVETWSALLHQDGLWLYTLLPRFTRLQDPAHDWPAKTPHGTNLQTAGRIHPNPHHTWPQPHPHSGSGPLDHRTYVRHAVTNTRPPRSPYSL